MSAPLSAADRAALEAELLQLTGLTLAQLGDVEQMAPADRAMVVDGWRELGKLSWAVVPTTMARVQTILNVLAAVASPVTGGVTGFAGAIAAIKGI